MVKLEVFIFLILVCFLSACGGRSSGYGGDNDDSKDPQEEEEAPAPDTFSTRLRSNLLIAGEKCRGGETSENNGQVITCNSGQYLITIDNRTGCLLFF